MSRQRLNSAAPELLSAAKSVVKILRAEITEEDRTEALRLLQSAIAKAEDQEWRFRFTVTPRTWGEIETMLRTLNDGSPVQKRLRKLLRKGYRSTARRVYCEMEIDVNALTRFRALLRAYDPPGAISRAFDRLIAQIEEEVLNRSALEVLAQTGI